MDIISISNMAIGFVGGSPISTLDDDTVEADSCRVNYAPARDYCLEQRDWTFASKRVRLTPLAGTPISGYSYAFTLPPDCLAVRQVSDNIDMRSSLVWDKDERDVVCDSAIIYVRYTSRITNTNLYSSSFDLAMATKLAELISVPVAADKVMKKTYEVESENLLNVGGAQDGMQGSPRKATSSKLINARYHGGRAYGTTNIV